MNPGPGSQTEPARNPSTGEAIFAAIWIVAFLAAQKLLTPWLDSMSPYAEYGFEAFWAALTIFFFAEGRFRLSFGVDQIVAAMIASSLLLGVASYKVATWGSLVIPFDLHDHYTLTALLFIAPVLEELVFRQGMWFAIETIWPKVRWMPWIGTSLLFAFGHFDAYFFVPAEFKPFILYQTAYTLLLGLWFGRVYLQQRSIGITIALHFAFNFGFWLGSMV